MPDLVGVREEMAHPLPPQGAHSLAGDSTHTHAHTYMYTRVHGKLECKAAHATGAETVC